MYKFLLEIIYIYILKFIIKNLNTERLKIHIYIYMYVLYKISKYLCLLMYIMPTLNNFFIKY